MIIIRLQGGLGNQMFQYALGRSLSLIHNVPFKVDSSYLRNPNQSNRTLKLHHFNVKIIEATEGEIQTYRSPFQKILDKVRPQSQMKKVLDIGYFDEAILRRKDAYFDGTWVSEGYFKANEKIIQKDFSLHNQLSSASKAISGKILSEQNSISVHIRRGDYVTMQKVALTLGTLPLSYYIEATKKILETIPDAYFFISSDDIEWAKENLPIKNNVTFISSPEIPEYEELMLMSLCKHNIIANSTFSWWGAWLNQNPNKIVIAPKKWHIKEESSIKDIVPKTWLQI